MRAVISRTTGHAMVKQDNSRTMPWRQEVARTARFVAARTPGAWPTDAPVRLEVAFYLARPQGHYGAKGMRGAARLHPSTKPDIDKLVRSLEDALSGIVYHDDAQVVELQASKLYALRTDPPRAVVTVTVLERTVGERTEREA